VAAALAAAAAALVRTHAAISHESGAIVHGLPVLITPAQPVVTAPARSGSRSGLALHLTSLDDSERDDWYGIAVTSVARTVIDVARSGGHAAGLITGDAALREGLVTIEALLCATDSAAGRPGNLAARWICENADPMSESPLESLTRAAVLLSGLPKPQLQVWIPAAQARVDLLFAKQRVVLEVDGMLKYTDASVLRDEKVRQERLEQAGYRVVRVSFSDVTRDQARTIARINRALNASTLRPNWS
jgi:very-short-patch-repair endonuclease